MWKAEAVKSAAMLSTAVVGVEAAQHCYSSYLIEMMNDQSHSEEYK